MVPSMPMKFLRAGRQNATLDEPVIPEHKTQNNRDINDGISVVGTAVRMICSCGIRYREEQEEEVVTQGAS